MIWNLTNALGEKETWYRKAVIDKIKELCNDGLYAGINYDILQVIEDAENGVCKEEE